MKIFMTGGTGFVGTSLIRRLSAEHQVTVLTRSRKETGRTPSGVSFLEGDPTQRGDWQEKAADHEVFINLAGASIFKRWSDEYKKLLRDSRIETTRNLVESLSARKGKNTLLLSTSAVGYYGFRGDEDLDESSPPGIDFLASLCRDWEAEAFRASDTGARVCVCRFGIVLGEGGGALDQMLPLFKKGLGSPLGKGNQWFSWIHVEDLVEITLFLIDGQLSGPFNCAAPHPVTNQELTRELGKALGRPTFLPKVPGFALKLVMGEMGSVLLKGQKVVPGRLLEAGFVFRHPTIAGALEDLLRDG
jgi:uncharacterized protein